MPSDKFWVYENGYLRGPFPVADIAARKDFSISMMICRDGDHVWQRVHEISEIAPTLAALAHAEILASGDYIAEGSTPRSNSEKDNEAPNLI